MELSTCCDAQRLHSDLCASCKEHADFYDDEKPEDSVDGELELAKKLSRTLVMHVERMSADSCEIGIRHKDVSYIVSVTRK